MAKVEKPPIPKPRLPPRLPPKPPPKPTFKSAVSDNVFIKDLHNNDNTHFSSTDNAKTTVQQILPSKPPPPKPPRGMPLRPPRTIFPTGLPPQPSAFHFSNSSDFLHEQHEQEGKEVAFIKTENESQLPVSLSITHNRSPSPPKLYKRLSLSERPPSPVKILKPLCERPLPPIPVKHLKDMESDVLITPQVKKLDLSRQMKRQTRISEDFDLNAILESKCNLHKSNLNKLKSVSSPTLFYHQDNNNETDINKFTNLSNDIIFEDEIDYHEIIDGEKEIPKFVNKVKAITKGMKKRHKWHTFAARNNYTKDEIATRKRAGTEIIEFVNEFGEYSDLHVDENLPLFDYVLVVTLKEDTTNKLIPYISFRFPPNIDNYTLSESDERMNSIPQFCFPDLSLTNDFGFQKGENFSFVMTDVVGGRYFGYCRLMHVAGSKYPEVYCIVSPLGLFSMYSQILDEVENQRMYSPTAVFSFLKAILSQSLPQPSQSLTVSFFTSGNKDRKKIILQRPGDSSIHEHVDLDLLFNTLPASLIIQLLSCLLVESKVILYSQSLPLLSSCCHAFISLLYPFTWEHTYIPVLPTKLIEIVCLPSPYLLGVMSNAVHDMEDMPMDEEVTVANLDNQTFIQCNAPEIKILPKHTTNGLIKAVEEIKQLSKKSKTFEATEHKAKNDVIAEVFVQAYINLIGHFEDHYTTDTEDGSPIIMEDNFSRAAETKDQKKFLKIFVKTQAFQRFTRNRKSDGPSQGLFENRFAEWKRKSNSQNIKSNTNQLLSMFKKKLKL